MKTAWYLMAILVFVLSFFVDSFKDQYHIGLLFLILAKVEELLEKYK